MKCYRCKNEMNNTKSNYVKRINNKVVIIEDTPTYICNYCYEEFYNDEVIRNIDEVIDNIEQLPIKLLVANYNDISKYFFN